MSAFSDDRGVAQRSPEHLRLAWFARKRLDIALDRVTWLEMARELGELCDVTLVSAYRNHPLEAEWNGVWHQVKTSWLPVANYGSWVLGVRPLLKSALTLGAYDVVVVDPDTLLSIPRAWLRHRGRTTLVVDVRTLPVPGKSARHSVARAAFGRAMARGREVADGLMVISAPMAAYLTSKFGWNVDAVGVWASGVDPNLFQCAGDRRSAHSGALKLVYHGSIAKSRGLGALLEAVEICAQEGCNVRLSLVGSGPDVGSLKQQGADLIASGRVEFVASLTQRALVEYLCEHDAGVIPLPDEDCWNTSSPLKLLEYLSCGLPVVLTEIPAHTAVVTRSEIVVWAGGGSPKELAAAISTCALQIHELSENAAEQGRSLAIAQTWAHQSRAFYEYVCRVHG